ncbi:MAG TPA: SBBP repeat-containing protein [Terracidiphilus sp.]
MFQGLPFLSPLKSIGVAAAALLVLGHSAVGQKSGRDGKPIDARPDTKVATLPLSFEPNEGQAADGVKFVARGAGYAVLLDGTDAVLALTSGTPSRPVTPNRLEPHGIGADAAHSQMHYEPRGSDQLSRAVYAVRLQVAGANKNVLPEGEEKLPGVSSYFLGNDPAKWRAGIPNYGRVRYPDIYPGVDLVYYGSNGRLEYDFVVAPGASPDEIGLGFPGAQKLTVDSNGTLRIAGGPGAVEFEHPVIYQMVDGARRTIEGRFALRADNTVGFSLGEYDRRLPLVIDPVLAFSTFLGGTAAEFIVSVASDQAGNSYVTGLTASVDFPTTAGAFQSVNFASAGNQVSTAFISKLNASGTALLYSTYLGGSAIADTLHQQGDYGHAIAVDSAGNAYITGWTYSANFPVTAGTFQQGSKTAQYGRATGFATKLNPSGTKLLYSTFLGGSLLDEPNAIAIDSAGDAFISGITFSGDYPVSPGAFQQLNRSAPVDGFNAFVTKLNPTATALVYSTYLGGGYDKGLNLGTSYWTNPIAVDSSGDAYVAGISGSGNFPVTAGVFQPANHSASGYAITLTKLNPSGSGLIYSTYLGGSTGSFSEGLAIDAQGNAYVAGFTADTDFPVTTGAFQTHNNATGAPSYLSNTSGFVSKVNPTASALVYSTYIGGTGGPWGADGLLAMAVDSAGRAYATGYATSADYPVTANAYQGKNNGATQCCVSSTYATNTVLTELNAAGTGLVYSTYFGGSGVQNPDGPGAFGDSAYGVALGPSGRVFSVGAASSGNFPVTKGSYETSYHSQQNTGYIAMFDLGAVPTTKPTATSLDSSALTASPGERVTFTAAVAPATGTGTPNGNIVFSVDETNVATVALDSAGTASWSSAGLAPGAHYVLASYGGNSTWAASGSGVNEIVAPLAPAISPLGGTYTAQQVVSITSPTKTGVLYFTVDGSTPSRFSTPYSSPLVVNYTTTVKAVAVAENDATSSTSANAYTVIPSPLALAVPATLVKSSSATLNGLVNPTGLAGTYFFQYGTSPTALSSVTASHALGASSGRTMVTAAITGLASKTTYYCRVVIDNASGRTWGATLSFVTQ